MARRTEAEDQAIRQKVTELQELLGYPLERAQATAFRMFKDGELNILNTSRELDQLQKRYRISVLDGLLTMATSKRLWKRRQDRRLKILKAKR